MKTIFKNSFLKEIKKIKHKNLKNNIADIIEFIEATNNIFEIPNIKKMKGYDSYYRIRIGNYRIGIKIVNDTVIFSVFAHRKDIYKHFPK